MDLHFCRAQFVIGLPNRPDDVAGPHIPVNRRVGHGAITESLARPRAELPAERVGIDLIAAVIDSLIVGTDVSGQDFSECSRLGQDLELIRK